MGKEVDEKFIEALKKNDKNKAKLLLSKGANPNALAYNGLHQLHLYAGLGDLATVKFLIENGATLDAINGYKTALAMAAAYEELDIVNYLLQQGANPNLSADIHKCWYEIGTRPRVDHIEDVSKKEQYLVEWFLQQTRLKDRYLGVKHFTPLCHAIYPPCIEGSTQYNSHPKYIAIIEALLKAPNIDVNTQVMYDDCSPRPVVTNALDLAIRQRNPIIIKALLKKGANLFASHYDGYDKGGRLAIEHLVEKLPELPGMLTDKVLANAILACLEPFTAKTEISKFIVGFALPMQIKTLVAYFIRDPNYPPSTFHEYLRKQIESESFNRITLLFEPSATATEAASNQHRNVLR